MVEAERVWLYEPLFPNVNPALPSATAAWAAFPPSGGGASFTFLRH